MLKKILAICAFMAASCAFAQVEANRATMAELDALPGVGPALSQRILEQRERALFTGWPDLIERVHGVGNSSAAKFSAAGLTVNGKPFRGSAMPVSVRIPGSAPAAAEKRDREAASTRP